MILTDLDQIKQISNTHKALGDIIVTIGGCFDILHKGHLKLINEASRYGLVWVVINTDESVRQLKPNRPINKLEDRISMLEAISGVSLVSPFTGSNPNKILKSICPNIYIKGAEYEGKKIPELELVPEFIEKIIFVETIEGYSTTNIVERIKRLP